MLTDVPVREAHAEVIGAWSPLSGPVVRGEAGARLAPRFGVFGFGEWSPVAPERSMAGVGARVTWGW